MQNLKQTAQGYIPKVTLNIADLDKVDLSLPIEDRDGTNSEGKDYQYKVMIANEHEYRVPGTVMEEIKKILKIRPDAKYVNVTKSGAGLNTSYSVELVEAIAPTSTAPAAPVEPSNTLPK